MPNRYNARKAKAISERNRQRALHRWKLDRARRDAEEPARLREMEEAEIQNMPRNQGDAVWGIRITNYATGRVWKWTLRIGSRRDQVTMHAPSGKRTGSVGMTWIMDHLRGFLAGRKV